MELEPRRYDHILNEAPDDVLGIIFGFLLFEASTAAKDDDGVRAPLPPLLPQSPAAAALGLPEHADLAKTRERADVAWTCSAARGVLAVCMRSWSWISNGRAFRRRAYARCARTSHPI